MEITFGRILPHRTESEWKQVRHQVAASVLARRRWARASAERAAVSIIAKTWVRTIWRGALAGR